MKLFSISCTTGPTYSNGVVVTPTRLFATTLHSDGAKLKVLFAQHYQNISHNMTTTDISRFIDESVHRIAYVESFGQFRWERRTLKMCCYRSCLVFQ